MRSTSISLLLALACLPALACGGGGDDDDSMTVDPAGTHTQYVVDTVTLPASQNQAQMLGFDLDGDDAIDNTLGGILSFLASQGLDTQVQVTASVQAGSLILLADVQATALDNATGVGFKVFLGANPNPAPCTNPDDPGTCGQHLNGSATFDIHSSSPRDALVVGQISNGRFSGGPGNLTVQVALSSDAPPLQLNLIGARVEGSITATTMTNGKLGGAVSEDDLNNNVLPAVGDLVRGIMEMDCTPDPCECEEGAATIVQGLFDANDDCMVTNDEVRNSDALSALLAPDVEINGVQALSIGLGFTATGASFTE